MLTTLIKINSWMIKSADFMHLIFKVTVNQLETVNHDIYKLNVMIYCFRLIFSKIALN